MLFSMRKQSYLWDLHSLSLAISRDPQSLSDCLLTSKPVLRSIGIRLRSSFTAWWTASQVLRGTFTSTVEVLL